MLSLFKFVVIESYSLSSWFFDLSARRKKSRRIVVEVKRSSWPYIQHALKCIGMLFCRTRKSSLKIIFTVHFNFLRNVHFNDALRVLNWPQAINSRRFGNFRCVKFISCKKMWFDYIIDCCFFFVFFDCPISLMY